MTDIETVVGAVEGKLDAELRTLPDIVESPADSINEQVYNAWRK